MGVVTENKSNDKRKEYICLGILAHVDAGKTTLSEAVLYETGAIRNLGRVDHKTAFLDTDAIERNRGITVFSKEARFSLGEKNAVLLDTPGHTDFSTEAERVLQVLDYAILVISASDGIQGHTLTLWKLLEMYEIPVFVFINKMDRQGTSRESVMKELGEKLGMGFAEFDGDEAADLEDLAMCDEELMEEYLKNTDISEDSIAAAIRKRAVFPVCFGAALKMEGIEEFLNTLSAYTRSPAYGDEFGAKVYKISRDKQGVRLTHMKITGGSLRSKMLLADDNWKEKAEQLRLLSGKTFESVGEVKAGNICAVTGLSHTYVGEALGIEKESPVKNTVIEPALNYKMVLPEGTDPAVAMQKFRQLEEEDPTLNIVWKEHLKEIHVRVMGRLELEILQHIIEERFDMHVEFGGGSVIYKETIAAPVIGIGHFEPLKHYAEVHLLMEPLPRGSGMVFDSMVSEDQLGRNWQRLIMSHLKEREHAGVLTGSPVTDMKITLIAGRAHIKHTEGGDFRQATYRAVRQGLRKARSILLEPIYGFKLQIPDESVGRALSDIQRFGGECGLPQAAGEGMSVIEGTGPAAILQDYQQDLAAYTKGQGQISLSFAGYGRCANQKEKVASLSYNPESDLENPTGSVFCRQGSAVYVDWNEVDDAAHLDSGYALEPDGKVKRSEQSLYMQQRGYEAAGAEELEEIFLRTYGKSKRDEALRRAQMSSKSRGKASMTPLPKLIKADGVKQIPCLIVDGYNVIFSWDEFKELATINIDSAREAFLEVMENYRAYIKAEMTVVFDGYRVSGNRGTRLDYNGIQVVYTKEAETADRFIEKMAYDMGRKYDITVVTSDRAVQMAALGDGAKRLSSGEFYREVTGASEEIRKKLEKQRISRNRPFEREFRT